MFLKHISVPTVAQGLDKRKRTLANRQTNIINTQHS